MRPVVVKVGGSLYDLADLGPRLRSFLATLDAPILIVPGGGPSADVVRNFDRTHRLGEEASHWLALRACSLGSHFLSRLLRDMPVSSDVNATNAIVDLFAFATDDERRPDHWPHRWDVTSDSMAVRVAFVAKARELILLKSVDCPAAGNWHRAAADGLVDPYFPVALELSSGVNVRAINFR